MFGSCARVVGGFPVPGLWAYVIYGCYAWLPCLWGLVLLALCRADGLFPFVLGRCCPFVVLSGSLFWLLGSILSSLYCSLFVGALPFLEINS